MAASPYYGTFNAFATVVPNELLNVSSQTGGHHAAALWIGTGGDVSVRGTDGVDAVFKNVPSGFLLNVHVIRVNAAGTTASDIVALYRV